ncbi:tyrosine-type DNA invertase [Providencia vermicola]|uniref:tyrosine-type DNA invertase n=1 Tax=Providencia vermicola TaxID=333965 RepID=UPI002AB39C79|nr:tyrosine-type recombinase/integrase [Providencia stuartii]
MTTRKHLTAHEVSLLVAACKYTRYPERDACLVYMSYVHGLRASEALSLRLDDLDLVGQEVYVHRLKKGFSVCHPLLAEEVLLIKRWLNVRQMWHGSSLNWLFLSERGTALSRQRFYQLFIRLGRMAKLPLNIHPHMLRHACGYALADKGVDTRLIQDYLGHTNIRHTVRYTASNPARFRGVWGRGVGIKCSQNDPICYPL